MAETKKLECHSKIFIWGMKDIAFREKEFNVWDKELTNKTVVPRESIMDLVYPSHGKKVKK